MNTIIRKAFPGIVINNLKGKISNVIPLSSWMDEISKGDCFVQLILRWSNRYSINGQDMVRTETEEDRLPSGIGWSFEQYLMINSLKEVRC